MATFFDVTSDGDLALLHSSIRTHAERNTVIDETERDILQEFTIRTGVNTYRVELEGYDDDTPASSHATLIAELKRAIARVASHRLRYYEANEMYQSEKMDLYEYDRGSGAGSADYRWPAGWSIGLKRFYNERQLWYTV